MLNVATIYSEKVAYTVPVHTILIEQIGVRTKTVPICQLSFDTGVSQT